MDRLTEKQQQKSMYGWWLEVQYIVRWNWTSLFAVGVTLVFRSAKTVHKGNGKIAVWFKTLLFEVRIIAHYLCH